MLAGLRYLNTPDEERAKGVKSVIHYDLKPGNILFDSKGNAKITDFSLSKIVSDTDSEDIELTSQNGYILVRIYLQSDLYICFRVNFIFCDYNLWKPYLQVFTTKCFQIAGHGVAGQPRITSAVDVFSCGVIYFRTYFWPVADVI